MMQEIIRRCRGRNPKLLFEGQAMQWPNEKVQKDEQWSAKHYTENYTLNNMN